MTDQPMVGEILLVEDDAKLAALIREYLEINGFRVRIESRGDRAVERILTDKPDLVILDIMLPGKDGLTVCREVRGAYPGLILMLTAKGEEVDEIIGLEIGADDYIAKPVQPRLLLTRIHALLRRAPRTEEAPPAPALSRVELGPLCIDEANRAVRIGDQMVGLTTAEFDLLWLLANHAGRVLTREEIYAKVRGIDYDGLDRSIDLRVARLRKKLGDDGRQPQMIKSIRGVGYLLVKDP